MGTSDLPEMYTQSASDWTAGIHFRQITHAHVGTINIAIIERFLYFSGHLMPTLVTVIWTEQCCNIIIATGSIDHASIKSH